CRARGEGCAPLPRARLSLSRQDCQSRSGVDYLHRIRFEPADVVLNRSLDRELLRVANVLVRSADVQVLVRLVTGSSAGLQLDLGVWRDLLDSGRDVFVAAGHAGGDVVDAIR